MWMNAETRHSGCCSPAQIVQAPRRNLILYTPVHLGLCLAETAEWASANPEEEVGLVAARIRFDYFESLIGFGHALSKAPQVLYRTTHDHD